MSQALTGARAGIDGPTDMIRLGTAFCEAKAVLAGIELGLFESLHKEPAAEAALCERLGLDARCTRDWLSLLVALGLLEHRHGVYHNSPAATRHLIAGGPGYVGEFLAHADRNLYPAWGRLADALRTGRPQEESAFDSMIGDAAKQRHFLGMMDALNDLLGPELAQGFDFAPHGSVADIGGARGNLLAHVLRAHPHLDGYVFDLPQVEPFFDEHRAELGIGERLRFCPGDFFSDELPQADVLVIGHVLHDWSPDRRAALVAKAYRAVRPGGALLVYDRMLDEHERDVEKLVLSLAMLLVTNGGCEYTVPECAGYLEAAGFEDVSSRLLGDKDVLVIGRKSAA
ncbi:methyltransferase [Streptomyces sp. NPDC020801]|uniref:methyltransferase n=1 Tax=unclassified Streptomyces TaxID=2593676 RepID=UPI00379B4AC6